MVHKLFSGSLTVLCSPSSSAQEHFLVLLAVSGFCAPALARTIGTNCTGENEPELPWAWEGTGAQRANEMGHGVSCSEWAGFVWSQSSALQLQLCP